MLLAQAFDTSQPRLLFLALLCRNMEPVAKTEPSPEELVTVPMTPEQQ